MKKTKTIITPREILKREFTDRLSPDKTVENFEIDRANEIIEHMARIEELLWGTKIIISVSDPMTDDIAYVIAHT